MRTIIILSWLLMVNAEAQIMDYTSAQIVTVETGVVKLTTGNFKLIHVIDLKQYKTILDQLCDTIKRDITNKDDNYQFLMHEVQNLYTVLGELGPRRRTRSIDVLGTAWKWIAGSPDHEDFQILSDRVNGLLENNHRQIVINRALELKVQEITKMTNVILNNIGSSDSLRTGIIRDIERKLRVIKEELTNIGYSIQWAKSGIVNSFIFSGFELNITRGFFESQNIPYLNMVEALEFGEVKIGMNQTTLIYVVNLPQAEKETCRNLLVKPVKKKDMSIKLNSEYFVICKNSVLEIKLPCRAINDVTICRSENLENITSSSCLPNLLTGLPSTCPTSNSQHLPTITELFPGLILLNGYNGSVEMDNKNLWVNGTYLIKYHNATVKVNNRSYYNNERMAIQPLPALLQTTNLVANYEEMLSLEMLKELHINNAAEIKQLATNYKTTLATSAGIPGVIGMILLWMLLRKWMKKRRTLEVKMEIESNKPAEASNGYNTYPSNEDAGF